MSTYSLRITRLIVPGIVVSLLLVTALFAGCTGASEKPPATPAASAVPVSAPQSVITTAIPAATTAAPAATAVPAAAATIVPVPKYTYSEGTVVAFTAASLKGATPSLAEGFSKMYPGRQVIFNLDGTQALKTQVQNGAYADVFISASNSYTTELTKGGFFADATVKPLTSNYVIVILPPQNPANIQSLADLAKPGVKIARADKSVPVGTATNAVLANLAKSTYNNDWNRSVTANTVTYETAEPSVATKVALGEVDAGFVYESTAIAAKPGTYTSITIPKKDNYLQMYTIGVLKESSSTGSAADFENFMLSSAGQQILKMYGFRPISTT